MPKVFISYRRADAPGHAGRLFDQLSREFGSEAVFMDVDDINPGVDFERHLRFILEHVNIFVVVIGPKWDSRTEKGERRLEDPNDYVRLELEGALTHKAFIVPVLVWGSSMPSRERLPESIRGLAAFNAFECRDQQWTSDAVRLVAFLKTYGGTSRPDQVPLTMPLRTLRRRLQDAPPALRRELTKEYLEEKFALLVLLPVFCSLGIQLAVDGVLGRIFDIAPYNNDDPVRWLRQLLAGFGVGLLLVAAMALWSRLKARGSNATGDGGKVSERTVRLTGELTTAQREAAARLTPRVAGAWQAGQCLVWLLVPAWAEVYPLRRQRMPVAAAVCAKVPVTCFSPLLFESVERQFTGCRLCGLSHVACPGTGAIAAYGK